MMSNRLTLGSPSLHAWSLALLFRQLLRSIVDHYDKSLDYSPV